MSAQQALALPLPAASNTVVINARCSLRVEADQRVGSPGAALIIPQHLAYMRTRLSRGISVVFSDLDSS